MVSLPSVSVCVCDFVCVCVQLQGCVWLFVTAWIAACQASLSFTIYQSLLRFMSIDWMVLSNHLILHCSLLCLPSIFPSIRVFSNELVLCIRWPKNPMNILGWISLGLTGLISLQSNRTLKSLLQHHSLKHQFFSTQPFLRGFPDSSVW